MCSDICKLIHPIYVMSTNKHTLHVNNYNNKNVHIISYNFSGFYLFRMISYVLEKNSVSRISLQSLPYTAICCLYTESNDKLLQKNDPEWSSAQLVR